MNQAHPDSTRASARRTEAPAIDEARDARIERVLAAPSEMRGTVPAPAGAHPDAYGLRVDDNGLGLHAAPGASVIVEPITPDKAGLAVLYLKGRAGPVIFDLTHHFDPRHVQPMAPDSELVPLIEMCAPASGALGRMRADRIEKIHRVVGVYTPAEIMDQHRPSPEKLPVMTACPEGMGEQCAEDAAAYPLVRPGETIVYDPSRREPSEGALCVLEWTGGARSILTTNRRQIGGQGEWRWWVDPVNRPSSRAMLDRRLAQGIAGDMLYASDGPYTEELLREKIVGTVVGVLVPQRSADLVPEAEPAPAPVETVDGTAPGIGRPREAAAAAALADAGLTSEVSEEICAAIEDLADAIAAARHDPDESDAATGRHVARQDEAHEALRAAPVRSLADLRAKLTYLLPLMAPDMLDQDHVAHLEAIRDDMDRLCRERSRPADTRGDAELLRLGEDLDRAHARWRIAEWGNREPQERLGAAIDVAKIKPSGLQVGDLEAAWDLPGVKAAHAAAETAFGALDPICEAIWSIPAGTPAGLAVKARAALVHIWTRGDFEEDAALGDAEDLQECVTRRLIEACCTLAGVDWRGDPIAPPVPDPVFLAIERHLAARAISNLAQDDDFDAAHDRRLAALNAVEATRPTTVAGLLALAAHMRTYLTEDNEAPGTEGTAGDHAFVGLLDACAGLHAARYPGMDRDWVTAAAYHPGFLPVPQHRPAMLLKLDLAIPQEARRLLDLAEAEFERRRLAYVGFHDPEVWPRVAADLRREMRMDALALVAEGTVPDPVPDHGEATTLVAAIEKEWAALAALTEMRTDDPAFDADYDAAFDRQASLVRAAAALPADGLGALHAKALALAWIECTELLKPGRPRDDCALDGKLALDIHASIVGAAPAPHPDAALLAFGPEIAALAARRDALFPAMSATEAAALEACGPSPVAHTPACKAWFERLRAVEAANGHVEAKAAHGAAENELLDALRSLAEVPATTFAGLTFKARIAAAHEVKEIGESIVVDLLAFGRDRSGAVPPEAPIAAGAPRQAVA